ncbi:MAG TPA: SRPBCC family protein [Thermoleophilaceae bacterium]|nr:SRPBCC family protein [Thermoleophilaceae bacterium]
MASAAAEPVHVSIARRFAFPLSDGYDYITSLERWPEYWPNRIRLDPESRWSQPGDTARLTLRLLGRPTELVMTLSRIVPYRLVEYTSEQRGLPTASHERHFAEDRGGFSYRIAVELERRSGLRRPFDRLVVRGAVERAGRTTLDNLERRFAELAAS